MATKNLNISGFILSEKDRAPFPGLRVEAWDKDQLINDLVGSAITDKKGKFRISFTRKYFSELFADRNPDLYFRVFDGDKLLLSTEKNVLWNVQNDQNDIELLVNKVAGSGSTDTGSDDNSGESIGFSGTVTHSNGNPLGGITVVVREKKVRKTTNLVQVTTSPNGNYSAQVTSAVAVYLVEAIDATGKVLASSGPVFKAAAENTVDLQVSDARFKGASHFAQGVSKLGSYWSEVKNSAQSLGVEDVLVVARQTDSDPQHVWHWMRAQQWADHSGVPAGAFYGWFRQGISTRFGALQNTSAAELEKALQAAADANLIPGDLATDSSDIIGKWNAYNAAQALAARPEKTDASLDDLMAVAVSDAGKRKQIMQSYIEHEGSIEDFWQSITQTAGGEKNVAIIQKTLQLATLTGNQPQMVKSLLKELPDKGQKNSLAVLAMRDESDWAQFISAESKRAGKSVVPTFIEAGDEQERVNIYAGQIAATLEANFPTASFFGKLGKVPAAGNAFASAQTDLLTFFTNNPDFSFQEGSSLTMITDPDAFDMSGVTDTAQMTAALQSIQRLSAYTTKFSVINTLALNGLDSASSIVQVPQNQFIQSYTKTFGSIEATVTAYRKAATNYMRSLAMFGNIHPSLNYGTAATPVKLSVSAVADPTLRTLFGSLDACECEHCTSVLSAAAYYADILNFLYTRASDCYNELVRRRPDLVHIDLTCENTNTPLPYVDLVIELLENFVLSHKATSPVTFTGSYQTTWQATELAGNPEHLNYDAYEELEKIVFSHILPFNFPLEETRVYLKHLGVERHNLMSTFFAGTPTDAFNDFSIAMERLLISPQESAILKGTTTGDTTLATPGVWNFYGFDKSTGYTALVDPLDSSKLISGGTWISALAGRVDVFLQQTDLLYKDLLTLLLCDFINPVQSGNRIITIVAKNKDSDGNNVAPDTCDLSLLELHGLGEADLKKIHRFLRLWRKLGWSMYELDIVLTSLGITDFKPDGTRKNYTAYLTSDELLKIAQTHYFCNKLRLPVDEMVAFWSPISSTATYRNWYADNYPLIPSLYEKLFRNKAVLNPVDTAFTENPSGLAGSMDDHTATIFAALQLSDTDYSYLKSDTVVLPGTNLTIVNLTALFRHTRLARLLNVSVQDYLSLRRLIVNTAFSDPATLFTFLYRADQVKQSGFSVDQLNYLLRHDYLEETAVAPTDDTIGVFLSALRSALRAIGATGGDEQQSTIAQKISEEFGISTTAAGLLLHDYMQSTAAATPIEEDFMSADLSSDFLKTYYADAPTNSISYEPVFVRADADTALNEVNVPILFQDYMKLQKAAAFITQLKLTDTELEFLLKHTVKTRCTSLADLPVVVVGSNINYAPFENLFHLIQARDMLPLGTPDLTEILEYPLALATTASDPDKSATKTSWLSMLVARSNWDQATLEALVGPASAPTAGGILKANFPADFNNGNLLIRINDCLKTLEKIGLSTALIESCIGADVDDTVSQAIKNAAKSKYSEAQWYKIAKPLRDELREKQREALVSYAVYRPKHSAHERWKNSDELYEYMLIDVEMKPISMTSRIKQAICSLQLFIDRVLLNLEHTNCDPTSEALQLGGDQVEEWKEWRKLYRVWEANRKIFLYPENWIEPELRDDKSPFFKQLETELKQNELSDDNVESAFLNYLERLDEVARLQVIGMYHQVEAETEDEEAIDILHVFARTNNQPNRYFHRTLEDGEWTAWEKIEMDIDGDHIVPVIFNRRLCLFWLFFTRENEDADPLDPNSSSISGPKAYHKIQVCWSEYKKGKWLPKRLSKTYVESVHTSQEDYLRDWKDGAFLYVDYNENNDLNLHLMGCTSFNFEGTFYFGSYFTFVDTNNEPELNLISSTDQDEWAPYLGKYRYPNYAPSNTYRRNTMLHELSPRSKLCRDTYEAYASSSYFWTIIASENIFTASNAGMYKLVVPSSYDNGPLDERFFFQDAKNTFYAEYEEETVSIIINEPGQTSFGDWLDGLDDIWGDFIPNNPVPDPWGPVEVGPDDFMDPNDFFTDPVDPFILVADKGDLFGRFDGADGLQHTFDTTAKPGGMVAGVDTGTMTKRMSRSTAQPVAKTAGKSMNITGKGSRGKSGFRNNWGIVSTITYSIDRYNFYTFYHNHVKTFIRELNKYGVEGLLTRDMQTQDDTMYFQGTYDPNSALVKMNYTRVLDDGTEEAIYPTNEVDFAYGSPYAAYNWELFFHVPMLIACRLFDDQRFEEAREWFHYIFDPTSSEGGDKERFWVFKPFYDEAKKEIETLEDLLRNESELAEQVAKWMDNPFEPHVIARMRITAYMKNVVMKYIDNLIAWGDQLFRRDTIESINEATNLYILASKILGERPQDIPPRAEHADYSFQELLDLDPGDEDFDSFSNIMVNIETFITPSAPSVSSGSGTSSSGSMGEMFYFCVPRNENLMKYWKTVADRLFKIRHSMNIEGVVRMLPLFEPPIDPAMLVRAAAAGIDLSSILSDMSAAMPQYRFTFMTQKANELCSEVKSLGSSMLQALEKRDAEAMSLLRSGHEQKVLQASLSIREKQVDDAKQAIESAKKSLEIANLKYNYYNTRAFMNAFEIVHLGSMAVGLVLSGVQGGLSTVGGVLSAIPNIKLGVPTSIGATFGGDNLGALMNAMSSAVGILAGVNNSIGSMASTVGGYQRRMDDWKFQASTAKVEIQQLEKQVLSAEIKLAIAEKEEKNQQLQIDNAAEMDDFMRTKFSNQELYDWMVGQISTVYFQSYQLAYDLAKKAEKCYQYELGEFDNTSFIQFGYWDSLKKGLLSAEKLQYDLRRMETSFYEENTRDFELTKHVSLAFLNPQAILDLRRDGYCTFTIPEELYDLDYPGHYFRRLKSVGITIPCIAGPYTNIAASLTLTSSSIRLGNDSSDLLALTTVPFTLDTKTMATSSAQNDSGMFELSFRDERYLPFEGCGAHSLWLLELMKNEKLRTFDYETISDVVIHVKYTASKNPDAGYENEVTTALVNNIKTGIVGTGVELWRMFSLRHEFPSEWYKFFHPSADDGIQNLQITLDSNRFPFFTRNGTIQVTALQVAAHVSDSSKSYTGSVVPKSGGSSTALSLSAANNFSITTGSLSGQNITLGEPLVTIQLKESAAADFTVLNESELDDVFLIVYYKVNS